MTNTTDEERNAEACLQRTILLDIPARLQWENGNGYCGETAIQAFGKYAIIYSNTKGFLKYNKMIE